MFGIGRQKYAAMDMRAANLRRMARGLLCMGAMVAVLVAAGQQPAPAVHYTRSVVVPLNSVLLFDKVTDAWTWTFGHEPGAKLLLSDRANGIMEGTARVNFRSKMLTLREESMGYIEYHVAMNVTAGECRVTVNELAHTGNRTTARGGVHLGRLVQSAEPPVRVRGLGGSNAARLYAEVKATAGERIDTLLKAFEARLRASAEP